MNATANGINCNDGAIVAQSVIVENGTYTSRLHITFNNEMNSKNISCIADDGTREISFGNVSFTDVILGKQSLKHYWKCHSIIKFLVHTASPSPPMDINWELIGTNMVMFTWSPVISNCSKVKYNIVHSECGSCPNTTTYANVTCTNITNNSLLECMLAVQTVVCGNISGDWSSEISLRAKGMTYFILILH